MGRSGGILFLGSTHVGRTRVSVMKKPVECMESMSEILQFPDDVCYGILHKAIQILAQSLQI